MASIGVSRAWKSWRENLAAQGDPHHSEHECASCVGADECVDGDKLIVSGLDSPVMLNSTGVI